MTQRNTCHEVEKTGGTQNLIEKEGQVDKNQVRLMDTGGEDHNC